MISIWMRKHHIPLLFLLIILSVAGIYSIFRSPISLFPSISFPRIAVLVNSGDRPIDRMIIEVTRPLEQAMRVEPGVIGIRSTSSRGSAEFSINFDWGSNMVTALLQIQSAINKVMPSLPAGTSYIVRRMDPSNYPMIGIALTSEKKNLVELRDFAYFQLAPILSSIVGVAKAEILGGKQAEVHVLIDPEKLREKKLTFDQVSKAISVNNIMTSVGRIDDFYQLYLVMSDTQLHNLNDIKHIILRKGKDGVIFLSDVANVTNGTAPIQTRVTANGRDAVLINIMQQMDANTVKIANEVNAKLSEIHLPADIQIKTYYDQSELIISAAQSVMEAILIGAILAAIILFLFLRNFRMTLIVALVLPCVLATTVLFIHLLNMSFNIMTLGGMAAAVGLIIDDGVVMLEHIMRRMSESYQSKTQDNPIYVAANQMLKPLAGSSLATIIIFLPLAFMNGITGGFFKTLALTLTISLIISFFYVFLAVPILGEKLLNPNDARHLEHAGRYLKFIHQLYKKIMLGLFHKLYYLFIIVIGIIIIGYIAYTQVGTGFMPRMDEGGFILDYKSAPGTSLSETDRLLRQVEAIIIETPDIYSYSRRTGVQLGGGLTEANNGDFFIRLKSGSRRNIEVIMVDIRNKISQTIPGLTIGTSQLMEDEIGDLTAVPQPIEIKLFGSNENELNQLANNVAHQLQDIKGVEAINNGIIISGDSISIEVDRLKSALLGLNPNIITQQIKTMLIGNVVSQIQVGEKMVALRIWTSVDLHKRISQLESLALQTPTGQFITLKRVADIHIKQGQAQITRENLKTMIAVTARIEGRDMGSTMNDIKAMMHKTSMPTGFYYEYGGLYQEQQKSFYDLVVVFICALLLVSILVLFLYGDIAILLSILFATLLSLSGTFLGLWITNTELNISSMMGITMVIGIVTEIAIFYFSELTEHSKYNINNIIRTGITRLRPILMTTIISILALSPLAISTGAGSAMQKPLAIAIIFGLIFAFPVVLIFMPIMYYLLSKRIKYFSY